MHSSRRPVSDARTDHREATMSFLGELGGLGPAAMRLTRIALVIYGLRRSRPPPWRRSDGSTSRTPSAPRYFSARMSSGLSSSPTDWDLERILNAIRASVLEAPANPGTGTSMFHRGMHKSAHVGEVRLRLPSPFVALLNALRLYTAASPPPPSHIL
ncbi:hypothetical protein B0H14DRAFT_79050 [Mycena olivaceomarginata]|nr:hypothetical protein B0H14DRAFT_79050 [Mycena olivaceomarginata]